jgi:hypothetical protein
MGAPPLWSAQSSVLKNASVALDRHLARCTSAEATSVGVLPCEDRLFRPFVAERMEAKLGKRWIVHASRAQEPLMINCRWSAKNESASNN